MEHCKIVFWFFLPAYEDSPETIHPAVRSFYNPASCFLLCIFFEFLCFFSTWSDVQGEAEFSSKFLHFIANIRCVEAKTLFSLCCRFRPVNNNAFNSWTCKFHIMTIGTINSDGKRRSSCVREYAALGTTLCSVDGTWPCFFSRQEELLLSLHP